MVSYSVLTSRFSFVVTLLILGISSACSENNEVKSPKLKEFNVYIGMPESQMQSLYAECQFEAQSPTLFGMCSSGEDGLTVSRNDTLLFYYWKDLKEDKILGFILFDPTQSYNGAHVGMSLREFLQIHPEARTLVSLLDSKEYIYDTIESEWYQIDSSLDDLAADYTEVNGEYEFKRYRDLDKKIASIYVK